MLTLSCSDRLDGGRKRVRANYYAGELHDGSAPSLDTLTILHEGRHILALKIERYISSRLTTGTLL